MILFEAEIQSGALPLPVGERVGVRGFLTLDLCNPSPDALMRVDLSLWER
jgi:hypothetical protein